MMPTPSRLRMQLAVVMALNAFTALTLVITGVVIAEVIEERQREARQAQQLSAALYSETRAILNSLATNLEGGDDLGIPLTLEFLESLDTVKGKQWLATLSPETRAIFELVAANPDDFDALEIRLSAELLESLGEREPQQHAIVEFRTLIILGAVVVILETILGFYMARRISRPIEAVTEAAQKVAAGKLDVVAQHKSITSYEAQQLVENFNSMTRSLARADREMNTHAAAIAHELRTPLTILRGRLQGFVDDVFDPSPENCQALIGQVDLLARIVEDMESISLLMCGQLAPKLTDIDLAVEVEIVLAAVSPDLEAKGFTVVTDLKSVQVKVDPARIRQALNALLENVQRYASSGQYVGVTTSWERNYAVLRVIDQGPGIPAQDIERVFDRWWRAESSRTRTQGGSGLGLAVVRAIAEAHNGRASAQNHYRGGLTITLEFPC